MSHGTHRSFPSRRRACFFFSSHFSHSHSVGGVPVGRIFLFVRRLMRLQIPTFCLSCSLPAKVGIPQQVELPLKNAENVISGLICLRSIWSRKLTPLKIKFQGGAVLGPNWSESYWASFGEFVCYYFLAKTGNFWPKSAPTKSEQGQHTFIFGWWHRQLDAAVTTKNQQSPHFSNNLLIGPKDHA